MTKIQKSDNLLALVIALRAYVCVGGAVILGIKRLLVASSSRVSSYMKNSRTGGSVKYTVIGWQEK